MRSKVRAYSHQGHGPRADRQAGYISATSDSTSSLAIGSRSIHLGRLRSILYRAEIGRSGSTAVDSTAEFEWLGRVDCGPSVSGRQSAAVGGNRTVREWCEIKDLRVGASV